MGCTLRNLTDYRADTRCNVQECMNYSPSTIMADSLGNRCGESLSMIQGTSLASFLGSHQGCSQGRASIRCSMGRC